MSCSYSDNGCKHHSCQGEGLAQEREGQGGETSREGRGCSFDFLPPTPPQSDRGYGGLETTLTRGLMGFEIASMDNLFGPVLVTSRRELSFIGSSPYIRCSCYSTGGRV
jgi:hypothetical protein